MITTQNVAEGFVRFCKIYIRDFTQRLTMIPWLVRDIESTDPKSGSHWSPQIGLFRLYFTFSCASSS